MQSVYRVGGMLTKNGVPNDLQWLTIPATPGHNLMLTAWYDATPFSHLLFVDADMGFPPELVADMLRLKAPLVGAFYAKRQHPPAMVGAPLDDVEVDGFKRAEYIGAGVMLISREMIAEMIEMIPGLIGPVGSLQSSIPVKLTRVIRAFDPIEAKTEDVSFCDRWRQCGGTIWANVKHQVKHIGDQEYVLGRA
jgi:hypothetical protein